MGNFIYVFDEDSRDRLMSKGYELLSQNDGTHTFVFLNTVNLNFEDENIQYVLSDTLTF